MSGLLNAMHSIFGGSVEPPAKIEPQFSKFAGPDAAAQKANTGTVPDGTSLANKSDGSVGAMPVGDKNDQSPLDKYSTLWQPTEDKGTPPSLVPEFNIDQNKLSQTIKAMDFTKGIPQELLSKAVSGQDPASMIAVMNAMTQAAFQQGMGANIALTKEALRQHSTTLTENVLPTTVRQLMVRDSRPPEHAYLNSPAVAPLVTAVEAQLQRAHPNASPAEIRNHALDYLKAFGSEVMKSSGFVVSEANKNSQPTGNKSQAPTDWEAWMQTS